MFFGLSALNKKSIGLRNIPPPIPINPEMRPRIEPINIETKGGGLTSFGSAKLSEEEVSKKDGDL